MGRSPSLILVSLAGAALASGSVTDAEDGSRLHRHADPNIVFDASAYLHRAGSVQVTGLPTISIDALNGNAPRPTEPVQSVPLPPAIFGMATLGAGWMALRGLRLARRLRRIRRR